MTAVLPSRALKPGSHVAPDEVREVLSRSILADGLDFVLDVERSAGSYLVDARTGERYLDMFTFFASSALGMNHPALADDEALDRAQRYLASHGVGTGLRKDRHERIRRAQGTGASREVCRAGLRGAGHCAAGLHRPHPTRNRGLGTRHRKCARKPGLTDRGAPAKTG